MMSIISLLNEPNTFSPANVDASVMYRRYIESKGTDKEYENIIKKQVSATREDAERDGVQVPTTLEEYCVKSAPNDEENNNYEDCILDELDDLNPYDADDMDSNYDESNTDSGNEES